MFLPCKLSSINSRSFLVPFGSAYTLSISGLKGLPLRPRIWGKETRILDINSDDHLDKNCPVQSKINQFLGKFGIFQNTAVK